MPDPSLLPGYPHCSDPIPVVAPVEEYILEQFMPIVGIGTGKEIPMGIPLNVVMPNYMSELKARLGNSAPLILGALKMPIVSPNHSWLSVDIIDKIDAIEVLVTDVEHVLVTGKIEVGKQTLDVSGIGNVRKALSEGRISEVDLAVDGVIRKYRFIPLVRDLSNVPGEINIPHADVSDALRNGRLEIPGLGFIKLPTRSLNTLGRSLSKNGFAQVQLTASSGSLNKQTLLRLSGGGTAGITGNSAQQQSLTTLKKRSNMPDLTNQVRNTENHHIPQLPHFPFVLHVPINQKWELKGYTRGGLINTFALAPQEELVIEVFTWDRHKVSSETATSFEAEFSNELSFTNKMTYESLIEAKNSNGWQAGFGVSGTIPDTPFSVKGDFSASDKTDTTNKKTLQNITEATRKSSARIKASRQTKVTESTETGREDRITRHIRNPNAGRILHFDCFEILASHEVTTSYDFTSATLCVLVDYIDILSNLTPASLVALEGLLHDRVPENLRSGFTSARKLVAWDRICKFTCDTACDCSTADGPTRSSLPPASSNPYKEDVTRLIDEVITAIQRLQQASGDELAKSVGVAAPGYANLSSDVFSGYVRDFKAYLYRELILVGVISRFWGACADFTHTLSTDENAPNAAATLVAAGDVQVSDLLNGVAAYASLGVSVVGLIAGLIGQYGLATPFLTPFVGFDDYGLETAFRQLKNAVSSWKKVEDDRKQQAATPDPNATAGTTQPPPRRTASSDYSPEVLAEADVDATVLINYISANHTFYRTLLWRSLDPSDRIRFLGLFDALNKFGSPNVIGFVGEKMAIEFNLASDSKVNAWMQQNVLSRVLDSVVTNVVLPVAGVTMQSRVDHCDALEPYLVKTRTSELKRQAAIATQEEAEANRRTSRVTANNLDDPKVTMPTLSLDIHNKP